MGAKLKTTNLMADRKNFLSFSLSVVICYSLLFTLYSLLSGCAVNPVTGRSELMFVSEGQEVQMGKELYPNALWGDLGGGGEYRDEKLKAYLKDVIFKIHGVSHRPNLPVDFAIQNSSVPNAWAIPGYVVITRGLLAGLDNEAEFAFVMGHEMGHVSARHSAEQITSGMLMQVGLAGLGVALQGKSYGDAALNVGSIGGGLLLLKYSRSHELEADRLGLFYMTRLGYDPQNAISAHRNLEKISGEYLKSMGKDSQDGGFFQDLLATHPRTSVRIDELQQMINGLDRFAITGDGTNRERFQNLTAGLRTRNLIYTHYYDKAVSAYGKNNLEEADSLISTALYSDSGQPPFHTLKGFIQLKKKNYADAEKNFNTALSLDNNYQPAIRGLGTIHYYRSNYYDSVSYLKRSLALFPQDISSNYFIGMSYFKMSNYKTALNHLKIVAEAQPKHPEIHGVLGVCYENTNDIANAYNEYVMQLKVAPNNEMGRLASSRAGVLRSIIEGSKTRK